MARFKTVHALYRTPSWEAFLLIVILRMRKVCMIFSLFVAFCAAAQQKQRSPDSFCTNDDFHKLSIVFPGSICFIFPEDPESFFPCGSLRDFLHLNRRDRKRQPDYDSAMNEKISRIWLKEFNKAYLPKEFLKRRELAIFIKYLPKKSRRYLRRNYNWPHALKTTS